MITYDYVQAMWLEPNKTWGTFMRSRIKLCLYIYILAASWFGETNHVPLISIPHPALEQPRSVVEARGHCRVVRPEHPFVDFQGPRVEKLRLGVFSLYIRNNT